MKVLLAIVAGGVVLGLFIAAAWKRAFGSAVQKLGAPTPETARVELEGKDVLNRVDQQAKQDQQEVANAKGPGLRDLFVRRMFRRK